MGGFSREQGTTQRFQNSGVSAESYVSGSRRRTGINKANMEVRLPISATDAHGISRLQFYHAPTVSGPGKSLPALLSRNSMSRQRGVLEMTEGHEYQTFPGPGGYCIRWSDGARRYKLVRTPSGHLILPCEAYSQLRND